MNLVYLEGPLPLLIKLAFQLRVYHIAARHYSLTSVLTRNFLDSSIPYYADAPVVDVSYLADGFVLA